MERGWGRNGVIADECCSKTEDDPERCRQVGLRRWRANGEEGWSVPIAQRTRDGVHSGYEVTFRETRFALSSTPKKTKKRPCAAPLDSRFPKNAPTYFSCVIQRPLRIVLHSHIAKGRRTHCSMKELAL